MAKGRMLATTIATDKRLNSVSIEAEYLYLKCIPHLDRDGLILFGDGPELWAQVLIRRHEMMGRMAELVAELVDAKLVELYDTEEGPVMWFPGFVKNQSIRYDREAPSRYEPPPGHVRTDTGMVPSQVRSKSGVSPDEVPLNIIESKVKESTPPLDSVQARHAHMMQSVGLTTNYNSQPPKYKTWFEGVAMERSLDDFGRAVARMAADYKSDKMDGMSVWQRTEHYLKNGTDATGGALFEVYS